MQNTRLNNLLPEHKLKQHIYSNCHILLARVEPGVFSRLLCTMECCIYFTYISRGTIFYKNNKINIFNLENDAQYF